MRKFFSLIVISLFTLIYAEHNLSNLYVDKAHELSSQQQFPAAIAYLRQAAKEQPGNIATIFDLANILNMANETPEALYLYCALLKKLPMNKSILYNAAFTLKKLGRIDDARIFYEATLEQDPEYSEARFSRSLLRLVTGDFERGWPEYEWRWKRSGSSAREFENKPIWDGSPLHGKTIYIYSEQGLGDTFQFIRYARIAKEHGGHVIVSVQKPLMDIIALCPYIDRVISIDFAPTQFDCYAALLSMPMITKTRLNNVPSKIPYLYAKPELIEKWRDKLAADSNFKVGICWQGNPNYSTPALRAAVAAKSFPVTTFLPLMRMPGVSVYNLQKETGTDQLKNIPDDCQLINFDGDFDQGSGRFMDTAAVIKNLDLVITVDTSIAHLAAGLGVPVWTFIPNPPDWRWMLERDDTPWYPNMRLFRQKTPGDWENVMVRVIQELEKVVAQHTR